MEQLTEKLTTLQTVALSKREERFIINTDVCDKQVDYVLKNEQDDQTLRPSRY